MTEDERDGLKRVEDKTLALLREADAVGKVIIVTNADNEWVSESKDAMPCVRELLDELRIEVISARERYEDDLDCSTEGIPPTKWKRHVFSEELDNHLTAKNIAEPDPDEFRVVSIGDGWAEFDAARSLGADINEDCLRIWRLADKPGFDTICTQLQTVERGIGEFAHKEGLQERYEVI